MVKSLFLSILSFMSMTLVAQINDGTVALGGQLYVSNNVGNSRVNDSIRQKDQTFSLGFNPSFRFFMNKEWALGGFLSYHYSNRQDESYRGPVLGIQEARFIRNSYGAGLFAERYVKLGRSLYFRTRLSLSANYAQNEDQRVFDEQKTRYKSRQLIAAISPGFSYFVQQNLALTVDWTALRYLYSNRGNNVTISHDIDLRLNMSSVGFGVEWFL